MRVGRVAFVSRISISVKSEWFTKYVEDKLGPNYDCYIAKLTEDF